MARKLTPSLRLSILRPRLQKLLDPENLAEKENADLLEALEELVKGLSPSKYLPILVKAACETPPEVRERLDQLLPDRFKTQGHTDLLLEFLEQGRFDSSEKRCVKTWLMDAEVPEENLAAATQTPSSFYKAYTYTDEFGSQGFIVVMWYTDPRRRRASGMSFLIDHNPPWEGAVKDVMVFPTRNPERLDRQFLDNWPHIEPVPLGSAEVKQEILEALEHNREEEIRLPRDLILARKIFIEHVLSLPDTPETPAFTQEDFNKLSRRGKSPERISTFEQTVGRRVRMEDGKEIFIMGDPMEDPFDEEEDW